MFGIVSVLRRSRRKWKVSQKCQTWNSESRERGCGEIDFEEEEQKEAENHAMANQAGLSWRG